MTEQEKQVTEYLREKLGGDLPSNLATYSINLPTVIRLIEDFANQENQIDCTCSEDEKHGETSVMCCNNCGKPIEKFWLK